MKSTTLLERQHRNIHQLCETIERGSPSVRASLLPQLANDLSAHLRIEEEVFYPAFYPAVSAAAKENRAFIDVAADEESLRCQAKACVESLMDMAPTDGSFEDRVAQLRELMEAHIDAEERLFPILEAILSPDENRALATRMMVMHHASVEAGYERPSFVPPPPPARVEAGHGLRSR